MFNIRHLASAIVGALFLAALIAFPPVAGAQSVTIPSTGNLFLGCGTATATAGAATLANKCGAVTSESLTTAQNAIYTLTVTNTAVAAADVCFASVGNGTNTQGSPTVTRVSPAAGSLVVLVANLHASAQALNGTIVVSFACFKP